MTRQTHVCDTVALEAARSRIVLLEANLAKAHGRIASLEDQLASARSIYGDAKDRLHEEIANAEQAEEKLAQATAYSTDVIEANRELAQRMAILEGFLALCEGRFRAQGQTSWAEEAARVLRPEVK